MQEIEEIDKQNFIKIKDNNNDDINIILKVGLGKAFVDFLNEKNRKGKQL